MYYDCEIIIVKRGHTGSWQMFASFQSRLAHSDELPGNQPCAPSTINVRVALCIIMVSIDCISQVTGLEYSYIIFVGVNDFTFEQILQSILRISSESFIPPPAIFLNHLYGHLKIQGCLQCIFIVTYL